MLINLITFLVFVIQSSSAVDASNKYNFHPECGESPTQKYKELAKAIGNFVFFF
jgi:hypothetical protein